MRGLVIGKFMPLHRGHQALIEFALQFVDELDVVVCTLKSEPIPPGIRLQWMREVAPTANVIHLDEELPQTSQETVNFWNLWETALKRVTGRPHDYVFASEPYGQKLAEVMGATFVPFERQSIPTSGTAIRENPLANWEFIPRPVRPYFAKRICVFGPESTGKTTLSQQLASSYETITTPEYARVFLEALERDPTAADMPIIGLGQIALEESQVPDCNRVVFTDTDALTTTIWSQTLFGAVDAKLQAAADAHAKRYDMYLLTDIDLPFEPDPIRYLPNQRETFFAACKAALEQRDLPYSIVSGTGAERLKCALDAVAGIVAPP